MKSWQWLKLTGVLNPLRHKLKRMLFYIQLSFVGCAQSVAKYPLTAVCVYVSQVHSLGFIGEWSSVCPVHPCEFSGNTARSTAERNSKVSLWWCDVGQTPDINSENPHQAGDYWGSVWGLLGRTNIRTHVHRDRTNVRLFADLPVESFHAFTHK